MTCSSLRRQLLDQEVSFITQHRLGQDSTSATAEELITFLPEAATFISLTPNIITTTITKSHNPLTPFLLPPDSHLGKRERPNTL
jgi:hypothetical protein